MRRTDGHTSTLDNTPHTPHTFRIVDRRAQYQAKVRNAGLHLTPEFSQRQSRGVRIQLAVTAKAFPQASRDALLAAYRLHGLDWTPTQPRVDTPPPKAA